MCGCAGVAAVLPPPPPAIQVSVTPSTSSVLLGNSQLLKAAVSGTTDTAVSWSVNGQAGGISGTIAPDGTYTAPANLPAAAAPVEIIATSHADVTKSASAKINLSSDVVVGAPQGSPTVELGATQAFQAAVTSAGHPNTAVQWNLSGAACASGCGSIDSHGNFTAPQILPAPANVTLTATSVADSTKQNSAVVAITSNFTLVLTAPPSVVAGSSTAIVATLTPAPNSNPGTVLSWSVTGAGCSGVACGTISPKGDGTGATYGAPQVIPSPARVTIAVIPLADPAKKTQATLALEPSSATLGLSPATATLAANHRITLLATAQDAATVLNWTVNGILGGSAATGQICVANSSPCQPVATGNILQADYIAPGAIPGSNPVHLIVSNANNPAQSAAADITIINHVLVSILPGDVTLPPLGVQGFTASVLGAGNQGVVWRVQGVACATGGCGAINSSGTYSAPSAAPVPDSVQIVAISSDDTSQSGFANVIISTGANILTLRPASVYTGGTNGFTLRANGSGFSASAPGPGSTLWIAGTARMTSCPSDTQCTAPVTPADVSQTGSVSVQIRNPDRTSSNALNLLIVAPGAGPEIISLTNDAPVATEKNISVVDPTTAGLDLPGFSLDISVAALGEFITASNTCILGGSPISFARPASGNSSADICVFSQSGLDTSMSYTVSGPGDVTVISKQPAGLGIIHLTLAISTSALPGARTIFMQNANLDETAASGVLQIR